VVRNRCKRRLREVFRLREPSSLSGVGYDLVINAKPALTKASFEQINDAFAQLLRRFSEHVGREEMRRAKLTEGGEK
jgi:ribonuclease P protein component